MMSVMTTRVGPVLITHVKHGLGETTSIKDSKNPSMFLDLVGNSMELAIRFAADYVKLNYPSLSINPLIGRRIF